MTTVHVMCTTTIPCGLFLSNVIGTTVLKNISACQLTLHFQSLPFSRLTIHYRLSILITLNDHLHSLTVKSSHVTIILNKTIASNIPAYSCVGTNTIFINASKVIGAKWIKPMIAVKLKNCGGGNRLANMVNANNSKFKNIQFIADLAAVFNIAVTTTQFWAYFSVFSSCSKQ